MDSWVHTAVLQKSKQNPQPTTQKCNSCIRISNASRQSPGGHSVPWHNSWWIGSKHCWDTFVLQLAVLGPICSFLDPARFCQMWDVLMGNNLCKIQILDTIYLGSHEHKPCTFHPHILNLHFHWENKSPMFLRVLWPSKCYHPRSASTMIWKGCTVIWEGRSYVVKTALIGSCCDYISNEEATGNNPMIIH